MSDKPTSFFDRITYGVFMLFFGVAVGGVLGVLGFWLSDPPHFNLVTFKFVLASFFVVGLLLKERGADFVAMCLMSLLLVFSFAAETEFVEPRSEDFSPVLAFVAFLSWVAVVGYTLWRY